MPAPSARPLRPAIFVDRDGVLIEHRDDYILEPAHIKVYQESIAACLRITLESPYALVVVTNQSAIGRGILTMEQAEALNQGALKPYEEAGVRIDGAYMCPHRPDENCDCRKPQPGMLRRAAAELGLDLKRSFLVGDNLSDMGAARAAGAKGVMVRTGLGSRHLRWAGFDGLVADDLADAVARILSGEWS
ncbi:MAG: HAD-IIIA family hydrolase [Fimbriimonas ginsengisoli]|uniref:D,D-heptose 1,7-bisphosphate phosphatase n=1 Tax=Fimbriimonas ginsengisoli TaxID=1005039 RepID=A0A931M088_FIMGI|nr:HAD-IIIA family hydrolase [Fimbriimonas ginsengisoli]